jgi:hypothetical protein
MADIQSAPARVGPATSKRQAWAVVLLLVMVAAAVSYAFRYQPLSFRFELSDGAPVIFVWDRWLHRVCVYTPDLRSEPPRGVQVCFD